MLLPINFYKYLINEEGIAINTAIIPEYGGSNFGIPAEYARQLLLGAGIEIEQ